MTILKGGTLKHSSIEVMHQRAFGDVDKLHFEGVEGIKKLGFSQDEYISQWPLFAGQVNIARYIAIYEAFKMVQSLSGHYADVGTWNGAGFLYIAKLCKIFEPNTYFQVHAFDWFEGMDKDAGDKSVKYAGSYKNLINLIEQQKLSSKAVVHKINLIDEIQQFGNDPIYKSIYYKYIFMDCANKDVLEKTVPFFWDRLLTGGIMLFDHFASDIKDETEIVKEFLPNNIIIKQFPFTRQPMGYAIKA